MTTDLDLYMVDVTDTIRTAMEKITANKHRAVVVVDGRKVVGVVSDGDIRRAILKEVLPMAPVGEIMNVNCITSSERDPQRIADVMRRNKVTVLPIVDDARELVDIGLAYEPFA